MLFMDFRRKIMHRLEEWKKDPYRKPLVIRGARQVGKTSAIKSFGAAFKSFVSLNLDKEPDRKYFSPRYTAAETVNRICLDKHISLTDDTLLFIDEIQNSADAVALMRYFYEEMPGLYVIGAGSLLEVMMEEKKISFPVGRVQYLYMYPMTFEEFLEAAGENQALELYRQVPVPAYAQETLSRLYKLYSCVGGMPEAVKRYVETGNIASVSDVYESLFTAYSDDVAKYAKSTAEARTIRHIIESAPGETGRRITFEKFGNTSLKSRDAGDALRTLEKAMLLYLRYPVTVWEPPFQRDLKRKPRLQFLDIGLLNYKLGITSTYLTDTPLGALYRGLAAEQVTGQELLASDMAVLKKPLFWVRESSQSNAELDFLLVRDAAPVPVEVKSGKSGTLRSLHSFIERSGIRRAIRLYDGPIATEECVTAGGTRYELVNLPLFLAARCSEYIEGF